MSLSSYCYCCVLILLYILLYICPDTVICSPYCYICVLILPCMFPHTSAKRVLTSYSGPSTLCETRSSTSAPSNVSFASNSSPSNSSYNTHISISSSSSDWGNYGGIVSSTLLALGCLLAACWCVRRRQLKARSPLPRDEGSASTETETSQELRLHILQLEETVGQLEKTVKRAQESIVFDQGGTLRGLRCVS